MILSFYFYTIILLDAEFFCPLSSTDRVQRFGRWDAGSIPAGGSFFLRESNPQKGVGETGCFPV